LALLVELNPLVLPRLRQYSGTPIEHVDELRDPTFESFGEAKEHAECGCRSTAFQLADELEVGAGAVGEIGLGQTASEPELTEMRTEDFAFRPNLFCHRFPLLTNESHGFIICE
jgi:hypothetical protein